MPFLSSPNRSRGFIGGRYAVMNTQGSSPFIQGAITTMFHPCDVRVFSAPSACSRAIQYVFQLIPLSPSGTREQIDADFDELGKLIHQSQRARFWFGFAWGWTLSLAMWWGWSLIGRWW